jgi:peptide/nickel transport system substrate-binding protein
MRRLLGLWLTGAVSLSLTACTGSPGVESRGAFDPEACRGGTLTVLSTRDVSHLDPARLYTSGGGNLTSLLFRTLTTRNRAAGAEGAQVVPDLATTVGEPSDGARTWTYQLKEGVAFEDGTPISARDIKYGIERSFAEELPGGPPYLSDWLIGGQDFRGPYKQPAGLAAIETPNDRTIVFRLRKPVGEFPYLATATQFSPVPKAKDTGVTYQNRAVSSGPYRIETYEPGKRMILVRNDHWSRATDAERLACPDRIEVQYGISPAVINQRLILGAGRDATAVTSNADVSPGELARVLGDPDASKRLARGRFPSTIYLAIDATKKPFDNPKGRQAISYAVNRRATVDAVGGTALAEPITTFLPPQEAVGHRAYDHFPAGRTGDVQTAKRLLREAGLADGFTTTLAHSTEQGGVDGPEVAAAVQDALKRAGIRITLDGADTDAHHERIQAPATQPAFFLAGWGADWPSGGPFLGPIFDGRQIRPDGGNYNHAFYNNPAINAKFDELSAVTDPSRAADGWGQLDEQIGKEALTVPLFQHKNLRLYGKNVKNAFVSDWTGTYDLATVSVK